MRSRLYVVEIREERGFCGGSRLSLLKFTGVRLPGGVKWTLLTPAGHVHQITKGKVI